MITEQESGNFKEIPEILENRIKMTDTNESIDIYKGDYSLKSDKIAFVLNGEISFHWFPNLGARFSGRVVSGENLFDLFSASNPVFQIIVDELVIGSGAVTDFSIKSSNNETFIKGRLTEQVIIGDKSVAVEKIVFSIPNLLNSHGLPVKITSNGFSISLNRLCLETDSFDIWLDKRMDYDKQERSVREEGGYVIQYNGQLINRKGSLKFEDCKEIFSCLNFFLSFLNGRRTSAMFLQGIYLNEVLWTDYSSYYVDQYRWVNSWQQRNSIAGLNRIWKNFNLMWQDKEDRNFLKSVISWYLEVNGKSEHLQGSIIMAQTALELLYNWWIVENKKLIIGRDSENISASNKIRLILSQLGLDHSVPVALTKLQQFIDSNKDIIDGPDAVVQIRNAIVHSQEDKRKKLSGIDTITKNEALKLCIWYIELALLCILKYDDTYFNRCSNEIYVYECEESVPWKSGI